MKLHVLYEDQIVGEIFRNEDLVYQFIYSEEWLKHSHSFPISFFLPIREKAYGNKETLSFFENLLPEGDVRASLPYGNDLIKFFRKIRIRLCRCFFHNDSTDAKRKKTFTKLSSHQPRKIQKS